MSKISRRFFLRGAAGTAVALPLMEFMLDNNGTAYADGTALPKRFAVFFAPTSLVTSSAQNLNDNTTPNNTGTGYDLPYVLQPIGSRNLQSYVSAVSGMFVPPFKAPGGYADDYHEYGARAIFTGVSHGWVGETWRVWGVSVDQVIANEIGSQTKFPSLVYQIDTDRAGYGVSTYKQNASEYWWVEPQTSPTQAYRSLFTGFVPPTGGGGGGGGGGGTPADDIETRLRVSSLSYVKDSITTLKARLGRADKQRLDQHFERVRALELRLAGSKTPTTPPPQAAACSKISFPADDPPNLGSVPDIDARANLFFDLVQIAFACDLTRSVSISMSDKLTGSGMVHPQWKHIGGLHSDVQHSGQNKDLFEANRLMVDMFAQMCGKLRDTPEGAGGNMLDNTAAVFAMEGGKGGREADGGGDPNHSTDNMLMLIAGKAGGLKAGQHVVEKDEHPAKIFNTAMRAIGVNKDLGEVKGHFTSLL